MHKVRPEGDDEYANHIRRVFFEGDTTDSNELEKLHRAKVAAFVNSKPPTPIERTQTFDTSGVEPKP